MISKQRIGMYLFVQLWNNSDITLQHMLLIYLGSFDYCVSCVYLMVRLIYPTSALVTRKANTIHQATMAPPPPSSSANAPQDVCESYIPVSGGTQAHLWCRTERASICILYATEPWDPFNASNASPVCIWKHLTKAIVPNGNQHTCISAHGCYRDYHDSTRGINVWALSHECHKAAVHLMHLNDN